VDIRTLEPTDIAGLTAWYDLNVVTGRHDLPDFPLPSRQAHMARFDAPWPGEPETAFLAWQDGQLVGSASALLPMIDNTETIYLDLQVHPEHRRRGIGTALLERVFAFAREHHRRMIDCQTAIQMPGGPAREGSGSAFAATFADKPLLLEVRSRWTAGNVADAELDALARDAADQSIGYSLVQWAGRTPADVVDAIAALESRLLLDAPLGDMDVEPQHFDAERIYAGDAARAGRGFRMYTTAARHDATGAVVAHTVISVEAGIDEHAWQQITIVDPAHRGHRLGLLVKLANHAYARSHEPALRVIDTWNAESNTFMRAVNEQIGFRPVEYWDMWQIPVPAGA
jgi:GNAT superfamily N-acetyltransferase